MTNSEDIDRLNSEFYNAAGSSFDKIPFEDILPGLIKKYGKGHEVLEIGSATGALAAWLEELGYSVTCLEPALKPAALAKAKGLRVQTLRIQDFETADTFDMVLAISSLIHVPKKELPAQIKKIARFLRPKGIFIASFIEGSDESLEDPTHKGKMRFFSKCSEPELDQLLSPYFDVMESHKIYSKKMDRAFLLHVCVKKS
ncbi:MAG: class I SAM-dependent methyltransferase [Verrucomicrobia bacterium]|nr:class I SAM-dependent methyltransferase [Verrucomicrobiota bacterium]